MKARVGGVNFKSTAAIKNEIKVAGGSVALLNLIALSYVDPNQSSAGNNPVVAGKGSSDYDGLIDKAVDQYDNKKDKPGALTTLQQAVSMDANNSRAYQLLGFMNLYGMSNFNEAERYMKESLSRGGSAVFRVFKRAFQTKTGSFKIVLKSGDDPNGVKFSFAPLTDNIAESKMIIRMNR